MTPAAYRQFLIQLLAEESIVHFTEPSVRRSADGSCSIGWPNRRALAAQKLLTEYSIQEYVTDLQDNNYSCLLPDAAFLQIEYRLETASLSYHRYCYVPAPFDLGEEIVRPDEIENVIDRAASINTSDVRLKTKLRFEFDEMQTTPEHPKSHLHVHCPACRIPVKSFIGVHSFFRFIYKHFYPEYFALSRVLRRRRNDGGGDLLSDQERSDAHVGR
jgi:hypothetical protein